VLLIVQSGYSGGVTALPFRRLALTFEINVSAETSATADRVIEAAHDFSEQRGEVWTNSKSKYLQVHDAGEDYADVTEGLWIAGVFWERSRYEWRDPNALVSTVKDSNVVEVGSRWELKATPQAEGSKVEMIVRRTFKPGPKVGLGCWSTT
jgi:hypothetical protein